MGEVYRATDSVLQRKVAVKLLSERYAQDEEVRARFLREALSAARLSGTPHVITVFDVGEHRGRPYIVMEYLEGGSVFDRLREGRVPPDRALEWLAQAARALDRAHEQGVVHRDVKPANLLLDREGSVNVSDFGIASTTGLDTLTLPGTILGTAGYLSPEQARGEPATPASDRYALGVVAFELLTGRRPFEGDTAATEAFAHVTAPVPSAERIRPALPYGVDEVLARALAKDPRERPKSCSAFVSGLEEAFRRSAALTLDAAPARVTVSAPEQPTRRLPPAHRLHRSRDRRLRWPALAVIGLVALLVGAALVGMLGDSDAPRRSGAPPETTTTETTTTETTSETTTTETTPTTTETTTQPPAETETETETTVASNPVALNDSGFALMQEGEYGRARPLLERAVAALAGSGTITEAYASYNLAFTRFALGACDGVLPLLDRSEAVQGERREIDALRRDWEERCADGEEGDEKGKGKGRGKGNDD
jgi:serine/threonine protein kinase